MSRARLIFDSALDMEDGEKMLITCTSFKQMESLRVALYRQRKAWQEQSLDGSDIGVTSTRQGEKYILVLEKLDPVPPPVIVGKDGDVKVVKLDSLTHQERYGTADAPDLEDTRIAVEFSKDKERQKALMREDGLSEEEIAAYFEEGG